MKKKERNTLEKLYMIKYSKFAMYCELYSTDTQMYTEARSHYDMLHNLLIELGYTEMELLEIELNAPKFKDYLTGKLCDNISKEMFKYGYM